MARRRANINLTVTVFVGDQGAHGRQIDPTPRATFGGGLALCGRGPFHCLGKHVQLLRAPVPTSANTYTPISFRQVTEFQFEIHASQMGFRIVGCENAGKLT
ncbi:MAG: hypothetical protein ACI9LT_003623 [Pseudoalteromonas distincta]